MCVHKRESFSASQYYPECVCKLLFSCDFFVCLQCCLAVCLLWYYITFIFIINTSDYSCIYH